MEAELKTRLKESVTLKVHEEVRDNLLNSNDAVKGLRTEIKDLKEEITSMTASTQELINKHSQATSELEAEHKVQLEKKDQEIA